MKKRSIKSEDLYLNRDLWSFVSGHFANFNFALISQKVLKNTHIVWKLVTAKTISVKTFFMAHPQPLFRYCNTILLNKTPLLSFF